MAMVDGVESQLSSEAESDEDHDVREMSTAVGATLAEMVRTTIGPRGMDKLLVDSDGMVIVTNDCYTLLGQMNVDLDLIPAGRLLVELAESQNESVGDGTATAVIIAGKLLEKAEDLIDRGLHPAAVINGYQIAAEQSQSILESQSTQIEVDDTEALRNVAQVAMAGTTDEDDERQLAQLVVDAIRGGDGDDVLRPDDVAIEKVVGGRIQDSTLVRGLLVDQEPVHVNMPRRVESPRIACLNGDIGVEQTSTELSEIVVDDTDQHRAILDYEKETVYSMVQAIQESGADVVFSNKGIDDKARRLLAERGILAIQRMATDDLQQIAKATGSVTASDVTALESSDLGTAEIVEQRDIGGEHTFVVETDQGRDNASLILRGGTQHSLDEVERIVQNGLGAVSTAVRDGRTLPGGGAPEIEVALGLREYADSVSGREQLAVRAFADAIEVIPRTLVENASLDPIDGVIDLRQRHAAGEPNTGIDGIAGIVMDMQDAGIVEPLRVKTQAISGAAEVVNRILAIDDILTAQDDDDPEPSIE